MKVSKAIEILTPHKDRQDFPPNTDFRDAIRLGIEALRQIKESRFDPGSWTPQILPGETPEEEVNK